MPRYHLAVVLGLVAAVALRMISGFSEIATLSLILLADVLWLRPDLDRRAPYAHGLPGLTDGPAGESRIPVGTRAVVTVVLGVAALGLAGAQAPAWAFAVLLAVGLVAIVLSSDAALRAAVQERRLRAAVLRYEPTVAMAFAGRAGGRWQLQMWAPHVLAAGERCVLVNLHESALEHVLDDGEIGMPVVQLGSRGTDDLSAVLVSGLRALFYVQNAKVNQGFLQHRDRTHVWLNHGDSDKPSTFNPRHAQYDVLVVAGQAAVERYGRHGIEVPPQKFAVVGRPQVRDIEPASVPVGEPGPPTVLYAPTWRGLDSLVNFSSLERGPQIVEALLARGATVIFRAHPYSHRHRDGRELVQQVCSLLESDVETGGRPHVWGERAETTWSLADCANHADALVCDVSSVASDFLASRKPYAMTSRRGTGDELGTDDDFRAEYVVARGAYVLHADLDNLDAVLDDLLGDDPRAAQRADLVTHVLGEGSGEQAAEAFAVLVRDVATGR